MKTSWPLGARGERPIFFPCAIPFERARELEAIPGVARVHGGMRCTWDAAPFLAALLGEQPPSPPVEWVMDEEVLKQEILEMPGLDEYRKLELPQRLRGYQKEGALFLARRSAALNCDPMRCVAGTAEIIVNRAGCARRMSLRAFVHKFNGGETEGGLGKALGGRSLRGPPRVWNLEVAACVPSYDEEGSIISQQVERAHAVGEKIGYCVRTASGREIIVSEEHQFRIQHGYEQLKELRRGDFVLCRTRARQPTETRLNPYRVLSVRNHPNARVYEVQRKDRPNEVVHHVLKHRLIYEAVVMNGMSLEEFCARVRRGDLDGLDFLDVSDHIHHLDGDAANNRADNLLRTTHADHSRLHAEEGAFRNVLWRVEPERIESIEAVGPVEMFDLEMADPYRNYVANDFVVHNSGKCAQSLTGAILAGATKVLIVCPALAKYVWAEECAKWLKQPAMILEGRAGDEARRYCIACRATGKSSKGGICGACKLRNGHANGYKIYDTYAWEHDGTQLLAECPKHPHAAPTTGPIEVACALCLQELHDAIEKTRFIIVNYDLLVGQKESDAAGGLHDRFDLPGWNPALAQHKFDIAIADEAHLLRGWSTDMTRKGQTRRERFNQAVEQIPVVWGLTGTPIFGYLRDLWGPLDAITKGAMTGTSYNARLPFTFGARYCLPGSAPVLMEDFSEKPIKQIKKGDVVYGWDLPDGSGTRRMFRPARVLETFTRLAPVIEVTLASGQKLECTEDHLWGSAAHSTGKGRYAYVPAIPPSGGERDSRGRILRGAGRGSVLGRVSFPDTTPRILSEREYAEGYLHGVCDGDGTISKGWYLRQSATHCRAERKRSVSIRMHETGVASIDACAHYARLLKIPFTRPKMSRNKQHTLNFSGARALRFFLRNRCSSSSDDYWRGWLAGIYDAEGWRCTISQYVQVNPETHANIQDALRRFNFEIRSTDEDVSFKGGRHEFIRFVRLTRPKVLAKLGAYREFHNWDRDRVVSVRRVGVKTVHCIKTETGNFVAYGYGSKNCEAAKDAYGWKWDGRSVYADTELTQRLSYVKIQRPRSLILKDMPPKTRQPIRIDPQSKKFRHKKPRGNAESKITSLLSQTLDEKIPYVIDNVISELSEGCKVVVFTLLRKSVETVSKKIESAIKKSDVRTRMSEVNAKVWAVHGDTSSKIRFEQAKKFVEHKGSGVFIATMNSVEVAVSLKGATSVHFADLHWQPGTMLQAEDRPYEPGTTGMSIVYYIVRGSIDEHIEATVIPKVITLDRIVREQGASDIRAAFMGQEEKKTMQEIFDELSAHADLTLGAFDDD